MSQPNKTFAQGLSVKAPHERAPDFVICDVKVKVEELIDFLQQRGNQWEDMTIKISAKGHWYVEVKEPRDNGQGQQRQEQTQSAPQQRQAPSRGGVGF